MCSTNLGSKFPSMVMISAGYSLQHLEAGLQFLARDGGRVMVLRALNPNHYTGGQ